MRDIAVVSGYLIRCPLGGYAWQVLHYLLGLRDLGFDAYFYEDTGFYSECFDPLSGAVSDDPSRGIEAARAFFGRHGLGDRWIFDDTWRRRTFGLDGAGREEIIERARIWLSLAAVNAVPPRRRRQSGTGFIDIDPGYTQIRAAAGDRALLELLRQHLVHFTIGERIAGGDCSVPSGGFTWLPTRPPVVLDLWEPLPADAAAPFSTIGRWDEQRREVEVAGEPYSWRRRTEWMKFLDLPRRSGQRFVAAMDVDKVPGDRRRLESQGWQIADPLLISADFDGYRDFIRRSKGEFTVAKDLNVRLRTGWFSDRAVCYLAAGRPVVNQDTGFEECFPAGGGVLSFRSIDEAVAAVEAVCADLPGHCAAARRLAADQFAAASVLRPIVERLL